MRRSSSVEVAPLVLLKRHFLWFVSLFLSTSLACGGKKISSNLQHANLSLVRFKDYTTIHPVREQKRRTWAGEVSTLKKRKKKRKKGTDKTVFPLMTLMGRREFCFCFLALGGSKSGCRSYGRFTWMQVLIYFFFFFSFMVLEDIVAVKSPEDEPEVCH